MVMMIEQAKARAIDLGLVPNRPNIRRVARAHDLVNRGHVRLQADFGDEQIYLVMSQNDLGKVHTVRRNGKIQCTCLDYGVAGG